MARRIAGNGWTLVDRSQDVLRSARTQVERAVAMSVVAVQAETKRLLNLAAGPTKGSPTRLSSQPGKPPHRRTGELATSIGKETFQRGADQFVGVVGTNEKHGYWMEIGIRGGKIIKPKSGRALSWIDPGAGERKFATSVVQGPILPRPFLRPALDSQRDRIVRLIRKAGGRIR